MLSLKKEDSEVDSCSLMCSVFDRYYKNLGGLLKYKKYVVKSSYKDKVY